MRPTGVAELLRTADRLIWEGASREAIALLEQARTMGGSPVEKYAVGVALLRASNGRLGWDLYDLHPSRPADRLPGVARWDGQPCRLLVVVAEQGFGDAIQFLRYVPHAVRLAESVVFAIHDELLDVASTSPMLRTVTVLSKSRARRRAWPAYACWERLMSLPARIGGLPVDPAEPYLRCDPGARLSPSSAGVVTVGVAWRSTTRRGVPSRSVPVRELRWLARQAHIRLVALHRDGDIRAQPDGVETVGVGGFLDTARVMSGCDYVLTVDTVTAHLAPALGVPTLVLLRHRPDWRWGTPTSPTRWYRAASLLFQHEPHQWRPVLEAAARRITNRAMQPVAPGSGGEP